MNSAVAAGENLKLYFFVDPDSSWWCISNTMAVLIYTFVSFASICFVVMGKQIRHSKRYRAAYMDQDEKPEDSEAEDDAREAARAEE
mmetsp:Transcript_17505/g.20701  ORF Transcript_17505/g.20701 Transcript_17505/m.20701 type:complete len:87 (+) Transcript_17505:19-279(+)